jgi:hypothetical protein
MLDGTRGAENVYTRVLPLGAEQANSAPGEHTN